MKRIFFLLTGGAFLALTLLIAALTANSAYQLARIQEHIDKTVTLQEKKIGAITRTEIAAFLRADRLLRMVIESDPFARDELYLEFNRAGFAVGSGRDELEKLGLTPEERVLFDRQAELIRRILVMQEKVTDFLTHDQIDDARNMLVAEGIPLQERFDKMLADHRDLLQDAHNVSLQQAREDYRKSRMITLVFGIAATVLGLGLGWLTLRRLASNAREIEQQMAALETSRAALEVEASHDAMTGLANRRLFYDRLRQALLRAKRYNGKVGVLFVDLNDFKVVNDLYGHHVGDALLADVARRMLASVRESDTVARAGGDEFMVILDSVNGRDDCRTAIEKIEAAMDNKITLFGIELMLSASIGQAIYPDDGVTEDDLIRAADADMYRVKTGQPRPR